MLINLSFRQLEAFVAVAENVSFTRGASALNLSQPALSQTISQLVNLLEAKLFDRTTRTVRLTRNGEEFLPKVKGLLADMEAAARDSRRLSRLDVGHVRIAYPSSISFRFLPHMIQEFTRRLSGIAVEIHDSITSGISPLLAAGEARFHDLMRDWVAVDGIDDLPVVGVAATEIKSIPGREPMTAVRS